MQEYFNPGVGGFGPVVCLYAIEQAVYINKSISRFYETLFTVD